MTPRWFLSVAVAATLLAFALCASIVEANPVRPRRAVLTITNSIGGSASNFSLNMTTSTIAERKLASSTFPKARDISSASTKSAASMGFPTEDAHNAALSPLESSSNTFCQAFVKQCYITALRGQTGEVRVSYACRRVGNKHSLNYIYSCSRDGVKITGEVLESLGEEYDTPSTSTIRETRAVTDFIEVITTAVKTDIKTITSADATVMSTSWTQVLEVLRKTIGATISSTTIIPYTITSTATRTATVSTTTLSTVTTALTQVFLSTGEIPLYEVSVSEEEDDDQIRPKRRASSAFCEAYRAACESECARVLSTVKVSVCEVRRSPKYVMGCLCKNNKRETQHALKAVVEDRKRIFVTILDTTTTSRTSTRTTILPTEVLTTRLATVTSVVSSTSTLSTTSTHTLGKTTLFAGTSLPVTTKTTTTAPSTVSLTVTRTTTLRETTHLVLAATGYVHAFDATTGADLGRIVGRRNLASALVFPDGPYTTNIQFMAVRDAPTGMYKLLQLGNPSIGLITDKPPGAEHIFSSGSPYYSMAQFADTSICGAAGLAPAPAPSSGTACEAFVFSPVALDSTPGATADTINLQPFWVNDLGSTPANHTGVWGYSSSFHFLMQVADREKFQETYPNQPLTVFALRFPFLY